MAMSAVGVIFSNINEDKIAELSRPRTMASIPFGGRYRLIDFTLSNMVNSGITTVGILTKNNYQSLMDHLGSGKDWDLARKAGGIILLPPYSDDSDSLYVNRLDALKGVTSFLKKRKEDYVVMADCDGVMRIDFSKVLQYHIEKNADITMVYHNETVVKQPYYMTFETNESGRIEEIAINPNVVGQTANVYSNIMIFNREFLLNIVMDAITHGYSSFGRDILTKNVKSLKLYGYRFDGYYAGMDSLLAYYKHSMELLNKDVRNELFGARDIYTKVRDSAPSKYGDEAKIRNSLVSDGCEIEGTVENSILFRGVKVAKGAIVRNSIIMQDTVIGENATVNCIITDKNVVIRDRRNLSGCETLPFFLPKGSMV